MDTSVPLSVVFRDLLDGIYNQYASLLPRTDEATPNIPDPMLGHNISWNWSRTHFETFMARIDEGRKWASDALEAEEKEDAIASWQRVFGEECFPASITEAAQSAAAAVFPSRSSVTATGLVLPDISSRSDSTPSRATTFHGEEMG